MKRSAKSRKRRNLLASVLLGPVMLVGEAIVRRPVAMAGTTAFVVAFSFVTANAIWYQPHPHAAPFFATRDVPQFIERATGTTTRIAISEEPVLPERTDVAPAPAPKLPPALKVQPAPKTTQRPEREAGSGRVVVAEVQRVLSELRLYDGEIDGLKGPKTTQAVENYRQMIGLAPGGGIDGELLSQLGALVGDVSALRAEEAAPPRTDSIETGSAITTEMRVKRIQAGLQAFGHGDVERDGVVGPRTRAALEEFQSLFGLPVTGEADRTTYVKMREIGLAE